MFEFFDDFNKCGFSAEDIQALLPNWKTRILKIIERTNSIEIMFRIAARTIEEVQEWLKAYEAHTNLTYSIRSTERNTGKYVVFKQRLRCHHSTGCSRTYNPNLKNKTKNTNCPSTLNITLQAVKTRHRYKNVDKKPDPLMPCLIVLLASHNHDVNSTEALRFRRVSLEVKEKLIKLFENGHNAPSAIQTLKMDINLNSDDAQKMLADRKYSPDYNYVYRLYKDFKNKNGPVNNSFTFIQKKFDEYNLETKENSAQLYSDNADYVICICSPLMRRVHQFITESSEMVFIDSCGMLNRDGSRIYTILTDSKCGSLPLAIIITSSDNADLIVIGLTMLKAMMGKDIFGGNVNGPKAFLTDDCNVVQTAIKSVWNNSTCLLSEFHVLQSVWRWLIKAKNCIEEQDRDVLFEQFRCIMYASSLTECNKGYEELNVIAQKYPAYREYLENYWERNHLWVLIFRTNLGIRDNSNTYIDAGMRLLNENIFESIKAFNLLQLVDFILTRYVEYYQKLLLDIVHNNERKNIFGTQVKEMPENLIDKIQSISHKMYLVPSESTSCLYYMTNTEILHCTCTDGNTGTICKHIHWVLSIYNSNEYELCVNDIDTKKLFYLIATGKESSDELLPVAVIIHDQDILINEKSTEEPSNMFNEITKNISDHFQNYYLKSPTKTLNALKKLEENLSKIKTVTAFTSACDSFGSEFGEISKDDKLLVQPTIISIKRIKKCA